MTESAQWVIVISQYNRPERGGQITRIVGTFDSYDSADRAQNEYRSAGAYTLVMAIENHEK